MEDVNSQESMEKEEAPVLAWGLYDLPVALSTKEVALSAEKNDRGFFYFRQGLGETVEKVILAVDGRLLLNPTEPLQKPSELTPYLLIDFEQPVVVEPKASMEIMVTFPVETACAFVGDKAESKVIDVFSLTRPKFTLYGNPRSGMVCKYWKSSVYFSLPEVNPLQEGIMKIEIKNTTSRWMDLTKAVFSAYGMKMYYHSRLVSLYSSIRFINEFTAETSFYDTPLETGMAKTLEQFSTKFMALPPRVIMEEGL